MFGLGYQELLLILVIVLVLFGGSAMATMPATRGARPAPTAPGCRILNELDPARLGSVSRRDAS